MDRVPERAARWWQRLDDAGRRQASWLALCIVVYLAHYLLYCIPQPYFIEDAGISFAYARNLVEGEGLVTYAGGERVEGYSNALWTFLVAGFYALGVPLWTSSKVLGALFGALVLPLAWDLTRRMRPGKAQDAALLAPLLLALTPPFVIWNTSGLENSLFCLLLASGSWRLLREAEEPALRPLSPFLFFLLTMTRPEGLMYAAIALFARVLYSIADRRFLPVLTWLLVFTVPWLAYNAWRYWYFAWEWPNTYYAKKVDTGSPFQPYNWGAKGWGYIKNYLNRHGIVYALPLLFFALTGTASTWRRRVGVLCLLLLSALVFWNGKWLIAQWVEEPELWGDVTKNWVKARVWSIGAVAVLLGGVTLTWEGWRARGLLWALCASGVFFALYSGGDWMDEFRWFNIVSVTLFPLLMVGLAELLDFALPVDSAVAVPAGLRSRVLARAVPLRAVILALVFLPFAINEGYRSSRFLLSPETSVRDIHRRVRYMTWVQRRLDLDHVTLLDVDMGAHVYFSGWDIVDIAGLVDVPMARHSDFNKKFLEEYVFQERKPTFAHVHAGWAKASRIPQLRPFKEGYIEIPGYPIGGRKLHVGNHVRKDTFIFPFEGEPEGAIRFQAGIQLLSSEVPSPQVAPGGQVHLRTLWRAAMPEGEKREDGFRVLAWLDDGQGHRTVTTLAPGYDWYPPEQWKEDEAVAGYFWIQVPEDLPPGTYTLGLVLLDEATGAVLPPEVAAAEPAVYLPGEIVLARDVQIVSADAARQHAEDDRLAALEAADAGNCEEAWPRWKDATRHLSRNTAWQDEHRGAVKTAIAECYVRRAAATAEREDQIAALQQAHFWDHHADGLADLARPLAKALDAEGDAAFAAEDWEGAYRAYAAALSIDPRLSWTRRKAEEARDKRLKITGPGEPKPPRFPPGPRDPSKTRGKAVVPPGTAPAPEGTPPRPGPAPAPLPDPEAPQKAKAPEDI